MTEIVFFKSIAEKAGNDFWDAFLGTCAGALVSSLIILGIEWWRAKNKDLASFNTTICLLAWYFEALSGIKKHSQKLLED